MEVYNAMRMTLAARTYTNDLVADRILFRLLVQAASLLAAAAVYEVYEFTQIDPWQGDIFSV